jgi:predicted transcriptional regulator of viral defense system
MEATSLTVLDRCILHVMERRRFTDVQAIEADLYEQGVSVATSSVVRSLSRMAGRGVVRRVAQGRYAMVSA